MSVSISDQQPSEQRPHRLLLVNGNKDDPTCSINCRSVNMGLLCRSSAVIITPNTSVAATINNITEVTAAGGTHSILDAGVSIGVGHLQRTLLFISVAIMLLLLLLLLSVLRFWRVHMSTLAHHVHIGIDHASYVKSVTRDYYSNANMGNVVEKSNEMMDDLLNEYTVAQARLWAYRALRDAENGVLLPPPLASIVASYLSVTIDDTPLPWILQLSRGQSDQWWCTCHDGSDWFDGLQRRGIPLYEDSVRNAKPKPPRPTFAYQQAQLRDALSNGNGRIVTDDELAAFGLLYSSSSSPSSTSSSSPSSSISSSSLSSSPDTKGLKKLD
jgi:hypothetical protein